MVSQGWLRTVTVDFPAFTGHLDLGMIPAGAPLTLEYQLQARGSGQLIGNQGLAGTNTNDNWLDASQVAAIRAAYFARPI